MGYKKYKKQFKNRDREEERGRNRQQTQQATRYNSQRRELQKAAREMERGIRIKKILKPMG